MNEAFEQDDAAEADAGFLVGFFGLHAAQGLEEHEVGRVVGRDHNVVVGLVQLRGDREVGVVGDRLREQRLELGGADSGQLDVAGVEFAEEFLQSIVIVFGES